MTEPIDLDALERRAFFTVESDENDSQFFADFTPTQLRELIAELRACRKVVEALRQWAGVPGGKLYGNDYFWEGVNKVRSALDELDALK